MSFAAWFGNAYFYLDGTVDARCHLHHRHNIARVGIVFATWPGIAYAVLTNFAKFERMDFVPAIFLEQIE